MRKGLKIGIICILCAVIGYLIGSFLPLELFKPSFPDDATLNKGEYYRLITSIVSAIITFLAICVALFKDDLRELWKCPKIDFLSLDTVEELNESSDITPTAKKYISRVEIHNTGNLPAKNTELFLNKLIFTAQNSNINKHIDSYSEALIWDEKTELKSIIIPPGGKKIINIVEIFAPENLSTPDSNTEPPILKIGTIKCAKEEAKGKWLATFTLYSENHNPVNLDVEIEWSGEWRSRFTEFKDKYQIVKK